MKDLKYYLGFIMLAFCVLFVACSDDDEEVKPVFPELQKLECAVGDEKALSFEATGNWTLTSSALWCTFVVDGENVYSCSGTAGQQTVNISIGDDATALLKSYKAELKLMMGGEQQVIFEVTRPTTGYELHAFNADQTVEYTAENPYVQDYAEKGVIKVTANADWVVEGTVSLDLSNTYGLAGDVIQIKPTLKSGFEHRKEAWEQELIFKNKEGEVIAKVPVQYDGIPSDKIEFSNDNPFTNTIKVSVDGESYTYEEETFGYEGVPLKVMARNNEYTYVGVEYSQEMSAETGWNIVWTFKQLRGWENWLWIDDDGKGNLLIAAKNNESAKRTAYLMVFPNSVYDEIEDDFETKVLSPDGIPNEYAGYIAANIEQEAFVATSGLSIMDAYTFQPIKDGMGNIIQPELYEGMSEDQLIEKYGTSNIYLIYSFTLGVDYSHIFIVPNGYTGYNLNGTTKLNGVDTAWSGVALEPGMNSNEQMGVYVYGIGPDTNGPEMTITLNDGDTPYAVLLIQTRYPD